MALCPNCGREVSAQAISCPNCGHPLKTQTVPLAPKPTGLTSPSNLAYYSIICSAVALLAIPLPLLVLATAFGVLAIVRGEVRLGAVGLGIVLVWILAIYIFFLR